MFDQILDLVKEHLGNNQQVSSAIPAEKADEVHHEIASQISDGLKNQASPQGGLGGFLTSVEGGLSSESPITSAISGGLVGSLTSKFGLPPAATGAIAALIPTILQKYMNKNN